MPVPLLMTNIIVPSNLSHRLISSNDFYREIHDDDSFNE
jgi:hypothetical protein